MEQYTSQDLTESLREVTSTILKCEKSQVKFNEGSSQFSLLRNRITALYISKLLIENELSKLERSLFNQAGDDVQKLEIDRKNVMMLYTREELTKALRPVISIINKCEKAQDKFNEGTTYHTRFKKIIKAMYLSKALIETQLSILE